MRNYHYQEFSLNQLIARKRRQGLTVGMALPVCNEEDTLSKTIETVHQCGELIDEFVVIDSNSDDTSKTICKRAQVKFIPDGRVARDLGVSLYRGKGWNLWASLFYLTTDIIVWVDSDIHTIGQPFITGLVGPLITNLHAQFVKCYYDRPQGHARVTEILARPFLNQLFPKTRDFVQPLSGEYGGRRSLLEKLYFYSGYSVEVALLIQVAYGLKRDQFVQSYLGSRVHHQQGVASLGRMGGSILYTLVRMAEEMGIISIHTRHGKTLKQFYTNSKGVIDPAMFAVADHKLAPMYTLPAYRSKFHHTT